MAQTQGLENEKLTCRVETERSGFPWFGEFSLANEITYLGIKDRTSNAGTACTSDKLQQFESFFSELNRVAREFFLSPERQRFGVVSERSLLKFLSLEDPEDWQLLIHFSGFPISSKILENVDELRVALQRRHSPIDEVVCAVTFSYVIYDRNMWAYIHIFWFPILFCLVKTFQFLDTTINVTMIHHEELCLI